MSRRRQSLNRIPVPAAGATMRDGQPARRFAITGWACLRCGATSPAGRRLTGCCEQMFAVRVDVIEPSHQAAAAA